MSVTCPDSVKRPDAEYNQMAEIKDNDAGRMPITPKGLRFVLAGLIVMVAGYVLLAGGGVKDPEVFNYAMFDFRRLVAAPIVILCGVTVIIAGIMNRDRNRNVKSE